MNAKPTLTCPQCGAITQTEIPTNACLQAATCASCQATMQPKDGDCCVFCSYGSERCPLKR